jgi:signal transduction histidine kinase
VHFDDLLDTVLAADLSVPIAAAAAWRQLVDLVGRGRVAVEPRVESVLMELRPRVPVDVRAASARSLASVNPPAALVKILASDDLAVAAPVLRFAHLSVAEWLEILPQLAPGARAVLRHRRDLPVEVVRALESFGAVDFVIEDAGTRATQTVAPLRERPISPANDIAPPEPTGELGQTYAIADVVARIEAFQRTQPPPTDLAERSAPLRPIDRIRFEADEQGRIRWAEGPSLSQLVGLSIAYPAPARGGGVDAGVTGAVRRRAPFRDGRLLLGEGDGASSWLISGQPRFDARSGRFLGYHGSARLPRPGEQPGSGRVNEAVRSLVHELRTPTNAIQGFSEMIEHEMLGPVSPAYRAHARAMREDAARLLAAVDDLDTAARIEAHALALSAEALPLRPLLKEVASGLKPLAQSRGASLKIRGEATVFVDARALRRVAERLLAALLTCAETDERLIGLIESPGLGSVSVTVDLPQALRGQGEELFLADDESGAVSLLGTGFALRLARNLLREIGGTVHVEHAYLTLRLPAPLAQNMEQAAPTRP